MESASSVLRLPSFKDLRPGQAQIAELFGSREKVTAQLPTGYGKTKAASYSYAVLRERIGVNRMIHIVPRWGQANQAANSIPADLAELGINAFAHIVGENPLTALKAHRHGSTEVFVLTIQSLVSSAGTAHAVREMMGNGRFFVVVDEYQHYGDVEKRAWAQAIFSLPSSASLAMSATPYRADGVLPFGIPDVVITYLDAWREGYVKELALHAYEYRVDAININGQVIPYTTRGLFEEVGSDSPTEIDKYLASKEMRWSPKYISPLIRHPVERLLDLRLSDVRGQMLVQAFSCSHAKMVCDQARALLPAGMEVDWVGTGPNGRSDGENRTVLGRFCPPKDIRGRRQWDLDVLVNVGIAGEGLDTTDVCEIAFLNSPSVNNSSLQTFGRGARIIPGTDTQPICTINVDGDSEFAQYVGSKVMEVFDDGSLMPEEETPPETWCGDVEDYKPIPDVLTVNILDVELINIRTDPVFQKLEKDAQQQFSGRASQAELAEWLDCEYRKLLRARDEQFNMSAREALGTSKVSMAVSKVIGLCIRKFGCPTDVGRLINTQKKKSLGSISGATISEIENHYKWVKQLELQIIAGNPPSWLM